MSRILIAPWGNPFGWKKVKYELKGKEYEAPTTLPLLMDKFKVDRVALIILDSLAEVLPSFRYSDVKGEAERRVRCFLAKNGIPSDRVDVIVSYSVGQLGRYQFDRELKDFYAHILWELGKRLLEASRRDEKIEIYLDLTHGINYIPTLVYRAVRKLGSILAITKEAHLTVLNSETPKRNHPPDRPLKIHIVSKSRLQPLFLIRRIVPEPCDCDLKEPNEVPLLKDRQENEKEGLNCKHLIIYDALSSAVQNGLPLLLLDLMNRTLEKSTTGKCAPSENGVVEYAWRAIENCFKKYEENITYFTEECKFYAKYSATSSLTNWIQVALLLSVLKDSLGPELRYDIHEGIRLDYLKKISERIWKRIIPTGIFVSESLRKDTKKIENCAESNSNNWRLYADCLKNKNNNEYNECASSPKDSRNFIAHSGITFGTVEIRMKNGKPHLRYRDGVIFKVAKDLSKHLPK